MKKIFSLATLMLALFLVSCKKDKNDITAPPSVQKKLKQTTFDENWKFTYNPDGSVKEMSLSNDYKQVFVYGQGTIEAQGFSNGKMSFKGVHTMSNGKPVKITWINYNAMGQPTSTYDENFEYNAQGLLKKKIYSNNSYEEYKYDANNDLIQITNYTEQGVAYSKTEYTYGSQKDLFPQYGYLNSNIYGFFFPAFSTHLPVSEKETSIPGNNVTYHMLLSYELDADGYVIKGHGQSQVPIYSDISWTNTY